MLSLLFLVADHLCITWKIITFFKNCQVIKNFSIFLHLSGGDDVQQLCEAGEEEFLEIMALVGMASKPLHVRRLQKALQEWVANPGRCFIFWLFPPSVNLNELIFSHTLSVCNQGMLYGTGVNKMQMFLLFKIKFKFMYTSITIFTHLCI